MNKMFQEFKKFAIQGNLIDIAIGLVMATAFGSVTSAFVEGFFLPIVGIVFEIGDMSHAKIILSPAVYDSNGNVVTQESAIQYGRLMATILNFIIIAFVMFLIIKIMNKLRHIDPDPPAKPNQEQLLTEIRDLLKEKN